MLSWIKDADSFLTTEAVTAFANLSSIVGLAVTIFVMRTVYQLRRHYDSLVRLPELRAQLELQTSALAELMNDFKGNAENIALELAKLEPVLKAVQRRLPWSEREALKDALTTIARMMYRAPTENLVRDVYRSLHRILGDLEQRERDSKWSA